MSNTTCECWLQYQKCLFIQKFVQGLLQQRCGDMLICAPVFLSVAEYVDSVK